MRRILAILLSLIFIFIISACSENKNKVKNEDMKASILANSKNFDEYSKKIVDKKFLDWFIEEFGKEKTEKLNNHLKNKKFTNNDWHCLTGNTAIVLNDMYTGALDPNSKNYRNDIKVINSNDDVTTIRFVGDVSLAENWKIAPKIDSRNKGIYGVLAEDTVDLLKNADIFLLNNEFTYSNRGEALSGKTYTFRAKPERAKLLHDMGADIVSLANNHAYDFGPDAFADTLETLKNEKIPYIGGGKDINEAAKPFYFIVNGRKFAFSAATRAEKNIKTPEATENSSGVMRTYIAEKYLKTIKEAEKQCDYNIVYVHWGMENYQIIEDGLYEMGQEYINAGADVIVGAHAHVLQGMQYHNDIPIVYNLGNFIFNDKKIDTGIFEIEISNKGKATYKFIPAIQENCFTGIAVGKEKERILNLMDELSVNVEFDKNGILSKTN